MGRPVPVDLQDNDVRLILAALDVYSIDLARGEHWRTVNTTTNLSERLRSQMLAWSNVRRGV